MERALRRTKRSTYATACVWKMSMVFIMLFSIACSMKTFLELSSDIEKRKKEIAQVLLNTFDIYIPYSQNAYYINVDYFFFQIEYIKLDKHNVDQYYIDLRRHNITRNVDSSKKFDYTSIQNILKDIGVIRCRRIDIDHNIPFKVARMLIERLAVEEKIEMCGNIGENTSPEVYLLNKKANDIREKIILDLNWSIISSLIISIECYPWKFVENVLKEWVGAREIEQIYIYYSDIEILDLWKLKMAKECIISIEDCWNVKSIFFPKGTVDRYRCIRLLSLPSLENIFSIRNIYSSKTIDSLILDRHSFTVLMRVCRENNFLRKVLQVRGLHLFCMPRTFQEVAEISSPWIRTKNIILYIEYCKSCRISQEEDMVSYSPEAIKSVGIDCLKAPSYENVEDDETKFLNKRIYSSELLKRIGVFTKEISPRFFECPYAIDNVDTFKRLPKLKIHLKNSKEIQEAIEEFQEVYNTLCVHAHYSMLDIDGLDALEEDTKVLGKMFACMGVRIKVDVFRFYNVKGSIDEEVKEEKHLVPVQASKNKFNLQSVEFYNSEASFIRSMFTKYSYSLEIAIIIDCKGIEKEEDLWEVFPRLIRSEFPEVNLINAEKIIEEMRKNGCSIDKKLLDTPGNLILPIEDLKWAKKFPHIINSMFSKKNTISSAYLSRIAEESLKGSNKNKKELSHFLVSNSAKEAYEELYKCIEKIYHVMWVGIYLYNKDTNYNSISGDLYCLAKLFKKVFVDLEVLWIINLRIGKYKKKYWNISNVIHPLKTDNGLKDIVLKHYTLIDKKKKNITTQLDYVKRTVKYYSGKQIMEKLKKRNVGINLRVLEYMLKGMVTKDSKLVRLKNSIIDDGQCTICGDDIFRITEAYIMRHCVHWMCLKCAIRCAKGYVQAGRNSDKNVCHLCKMSAEFDKEFYLLNLKNLEREEQIKAYIEKEKEEEKARSNQRALEQPKRKQKKTKKATQTVPSNHKEKFEVFRACPLAPPDPDSLMLS
ncbi:hypothetical protein NEFER02_0911 [Nematocida sp. LUAm2]|nr:hypothetical protein NEFER02_0911 [Nematocida sp. LUAm2]